MAETIHTHTRNRTRTDIINFGGAVAVGFTTYVVDFDWADKTVSSWWSGGLFMDWFELSWWKTVLCRNNIGDWNRPIWCLVPEVVRKCLIAGTEAGRFASGNMRQNRGLWPSLLWREKGFNFTRGYTDTSRRNRVVRCWSEINVVFTLAELTCSA